jgi:aspartate/methionine/tyrosine aminotransferase
VSGVGDAAAARLLGVEHSPTAIDLSVGEPDFDTPEAISRAGIEAIEAGETRYTPRLGFADLREAICARLTTEKRYEPAFEDVVVTAGGSPGVSIAIAATCRAGDTLIVPDPSWPNYELFATRLGAHCRRYRQRASTPLDLDEIESLVDSSTKLIVVNSPANPTGAIVSRDDLEVLVDLAQRRGLWILSDEAYESIVFDRRETFSPCALGGSERTFASYTFSKKYAMTGWRVGYLVTPPPFRRAALELHAAMSGCAPAMAQRAAMRALTDGQTAAEAMRVAFERRRNLALEVLSGSDLVDGEPEGAFYLWLNVQRSRHTGIDFTTLLARDADVVVSAGEVYTDASDHHVRVSFAASDDSLRLALQRVRSTVDRLAERDAHPSAECQPLAKPEVG